MLTDLQEFLHTFRPIIRSSSVFVNYKICLSVMTLSIFNLHYFAKGKNFFFFVAKNLYNFFNDTEFTAIVSVMETVRSSRILCFNAPNLLVHL